MLKLAVMAFADGEPMEVSALCAREGVSTKTFYKSVARYRAEGEAGGSCVWVAVPPTSLPPTLTPRGPLVCVSEDHQFRRSCSHRPASRDLREPGSLIPT